MPRKGSITVQTTVDIRLLAGIIREFDRQGQPPSSSLSNYIRRIIGAINDALEPIPFESSEEAYRFLVSRGFSTKQFQSGGRSSISLAKAVHLEERAGEDAETGDSPHEDPRFAEARSLLEAAGVETKPKGNNE